MLDDLDEKIQEARQAEIQQRVLAQQAARRGQEAHGPAMHPMPAMAAPQSPLDAMVKATNAAWAKENDSRVRQMEAERDRQHELELEAMRQQSKQQEQAAQQQQQSQLDQVRQARNRSLLARAGIGGRTTAVNQDGSRETVPHPFGSNPFARSLLG